MIRLIRKTKSLAHVYLLCIFLENRATKYAGKSTKTTVAGQGLKSPDHVPGFSEKVFLELSICFHEEAPHAGQKARLAGFASEPRYQKSKEDTHLYLYTTHRHAYAPFMEKTTGSQKYCQVIKSYPWSLRRCGASDKICRIIWSPSAPPSNAARSSNLLRNTV